ncbi:MAG: HypC/HybG/HupF family hydrogenase formation chaperone [Polaromonas sp.]
MCIGIPMQVLSLEPGHARCHGRSELRRIRTALVGTVAPGDWVLVFLDSAQEIISSQRAQEINGTLDLLAAVMRGHETGTPPSHEAASFDLPSRMSREQLLALSGGTP